MDVCKTTDSPLIPIGSLEKGHMSEPFPIAD